MKKDAYYFPHDCNAKDDPKCARLIDEIGLEGYGVYWILIEKLREQPGYRYPLHLVQVIARQYNTTHELVSKVINEFDLFCVTKSHFFSKSLNRRMGPLDERREKLSNAGKKGIRVKMSRLMAREKGIQVEANIKPPLTQAETTLEPPLILAEASFKQLDKNRKEKNRENDFIKPSLTDIEAYCKENNINIDPSTFHNYYEANGWVFGTNRTPIKDWRAKIRSWEKKRQEPSTKLGVGESLNSNGQRTYGTDAIVPYDAPPRPSDKHFWHKSANEWRRN